MSWICGQEDLEVKVSTVLESIFLQFCEQFNLPSYHHLHTSIATDDTKTPL